MQLDTIYMLNDGNQVVIKQVFNHYQSQQIDYLIATQEGEYIITQQELAAQLRKKRTTAEKLALFHRYFAGRDDVYAQKWSNGKGYSPALTNWWDFYQVRDDKVAQKKLTKKYKPYTEKTIYDQIAKTDSYHRYGIYPLLKGDQTRLLVFDFDKHSSPVDPRKTTKAVLATCLKYGIECLPEISSSGSSYHLWIFFSQPIDASTARLLGKLILIESMANSEDVDLSCFDRMIPNQDKLPNKGFGNLIALPLKWSDVQQKRSIFTDNDLLPLMPELLFDRLAATRRYSNDEVWSFIKKINQDMGLLQSEKSLLDLNSFTDLPREITGIVAGEIIIKRQGLTRREQLGLLNLATFANPEFLKKQQMRMPVWNVPAMLTTARITRENLYLPRGILNTLQVKCHCHLTMHFTSPSTLDVSFTGKLRPEQAQAVRKASKHNLGVICAHTGFGKTVVGYALIAQRKVRTLIVVPTTNIAQQWQKAGLKFLKIENDPFLEHTPTGREVRKKKIEIISGTRNHPSKLIDVINIRKLIQMSASERKNVYQDYGQIIIDECHHIPAATFEKTLIEANVRYILGLTATPERKDGLEKFISYRCGSIVYQSAKEDTHLIQRYLYPRYSNAFEEQKVFNGNSYSQKLNALAEDDDRNEQIIKDVSRALAENRHILLLSERIKHLERLYQLLRSTGNTHIYLITGGGKNTLDLKNEQEPYIILSTNKYVGEGFDLPSLDTLFLTMPFSWQGSTKQYLGRLERGLAKKDELRVYDYVDIADDVFAKMYQKRVKVYRQLGYQPVKSKKWNTYSATYYTDQNYRPIWEHDLEKATDIFIRVRQLSKEQLEKFEKLAVKEKQVHLELATKMKEKKFIRSALDLLTSNLIIDFKDDIRNNLCIFDHKFFWYGDLNFGGKSYHGMTGIRLINQHLANETLKKH